METVITEITSCWTSSGLSDHLKGGPLVVRRTSAAIPEEEKLGDEEILGRIMLKARTLPKHSWNFSNNHIMVNSERTKLSIPPLRRFPELDELAREHAALMAGANELSHSDPAHINARFTRHCRRLGENVTSGSDLQDIHIGMMDSLADKNNILDRHFTSLGIGTSVASDGTLYLCQIFRG
jgi:hypothetical protein